jgi:bis(5'-nucleosyl)-tetraphosphatase (symmetrical)
VARYIVGDIQGCFKALMALLEAVEFDPHRDTLFSVGDLINRGHDNLSTLRWFVQHDAAVKVVLGNHDLHLLAIATGARKASRADNLEDVLEAPDAGELLNWIRHRPLLHREADFTLVHAGIPPQWSIATAQECAEEVSDALRGDKYKRYLKAMYGNTPDIWSDELSGKKRLRLITNYLTRMRFCTATGALDLRSKGTKPARKKLYGEKLAPWFAHAHRETIDELIIFGHWAALQGETGEARVIGLDTGCVWGNDMTLLCPDSGTKWSVSAEGGDVLEVLGVL